MALDEQIRIALAENPDATPEEIAEKIGESVRRTKAEVRFADENKLFEIQV